MKGQERFIEVGVTALRDPVTHEFLPSVPLYVKAEDGNEEGLIHEIGRLFADMLGKYKHTFEEDKAAEQAAWEEKEEKKRGKKA